ncbi:MAG: outer membrane lipoprotein-sorting protein [Deltaproteobacteria bacterium]|nr:outer membrane lipoprotein-sorting protein [Deltaproteobacteria bacterium]
MAGKCRGTGRPPRSPRASTRAAPATCWWRCPGGQAPTPRSSTGSSSYSKVVNWIDQETFITYKAEYYDKKDRHAKTLTMSGWQQVNGIWTPTDMVMHNLKRNSQTSIQMIEVEYGTAIEDDKFTTAFLTTF